MEAFACRSSECGSEQLSGNFLTQTVNLCFNALRAASSTCSLPLMTISGSVHVAAPVGLVQKVTCPAVLPDAKVAVGG